MGEFFEVHRDPYNLPISFYLSINRQGGNQIGFGTTFAGLPVFSAHHSYNQEGGAWYSPFINFFKKPLVKKFGKKLAGQLVSTGGQILSDVVSSGKQSGKVDMNELSNIAKKRIAEGGANLLDFGAETLRNYQTGSGRRKRVRTRKKRKRVGRKKGKKQYKTVRRGRIRKKKKSVKRRKRKRTTVVKKNKIKRRRGRKRKALTTVDAFLKG